MAKTKVKVSLLVLSCTCCHKFSISIFDKFACFSVQICLGNPSKPGFRKDFMVAYTSPRIAQQAHNVTPMLSKVELHWNNNAFLFGYCMNAAVSINACLAVYRIDFALRLPVLLPCHVNLHFTCYFITYFHVSNDKYCIQYVVNGSCDYFDFVLTLYMYGVYN